MKFLRDLVAKAPKSSGELESAVETIAAEIADLEQRHALLRAALVSAPFEQSADEVAAMRAKVRDLADDIEFAKATKAEAERRRDEAKQSETAEAVARRMADARKDWDALLEAWLAYEAGLDAAAAQLATIRRLYNSVAKANGYAVEHGRPDLQLRNQVSEQTGLLANRLAGLKEASPAPDMKRLVETGRTHVGAAK